MARKNPRTITPRKSTEGGYATPARRAAISSPPRHSETTISATLAPNQSSAYSSRSLRWRMSWKTSRMIATLPRTAMIWIRGFTEGPHDRPARRAHADRQQHLAHVVERAIEGDRRAPPLPLAHRHRDLPHPEPVAAEGDHRLGLGIVVRVLARQEGDRRASVGAEAGGIVGDRLPEHQRVHRAEDRDAEPAQQRRPVATRLQEARADRHVAAVAAERVQQPGDL